MISLRHVSRSFGRVTAVDRVSLDLPAGSAVAILGPSGSGKTTLLRLVAGLEELDAGEIWIGGALAGAPGWTLAPHQRGIGFVFQAPALWPHLTVGQNVLFGIHGLPRSEARGRVHRLLVSTGLNGLERRYPYELSGGEARRVALARALAPGPRRLLMDEPLTNVDRDLKRALLSLVRETVQQTGASLLYVTHDPAEVAELSARVLVLEHGRVVS